MPQEPRFAPLLDNTVRLLAVRNQTASDSFAKQAASKAFGILVNCANGLFYPQPEKGWKSCRNREPPNLFVASYAALLLANNLDSFPQIGRVGWSNYAKLISASLTTLARGDLGCNEKEVEDWVATERALSRNPATFNSLMAPLRRGLSKGNKLPPTTDEIYHTAMTAAAARLARHGAIPRIEKGLSEYWNDLSVKTAAKKNKRAGSNDEQNVEGDRHDEPNEDDGSEESSPVACLGFPIAVHAQPAAQPLMQFDAPAAADYYGDYCVIAGSEVRVGAGLGEREYEAIHYYNNETTHQEAADQNDPYATFCEVASAMDLSPAFVLPSLEVAVVPGSPVLSDEQSEAIDALDATMAPFEEACFEETYSVAASEEARVPSERSSVRGGAMSLPGARSFQVSRSSGLVEQAPRGARKTKLQTAAAKHLFSISHQAQDKTTGRAITGHPLF